MSDSEDEGGKYSYLIMEPSIQTNLFAACYLYLLHNLLMKICDIGTKQTIKTKINHYENKSLHKLINIHKTWL